MEEKNYPQLRDALDQLPQYQPPDGIWDALDAQLLSDEKLTVPLQNLPQHQPPQQIWANIEAGLDRDRAATRRQGAWQVFVGWQRLAAAAAVAVALASVAFLGGRFFKQEPPLVVRQEQADERLLETLREPENPDFELIQNLCLDRQPVCQQPDFQLLKSELDELTAAKIELKTALGNFADDPELVAEMVKIERSRSRILEQMMQMI